MFSSDFEVISVFNNDMIIDCCLLYPEIVSKISKNPHRFLIVVDSNGRYVGLISSEQIELVRVSSLYLSCDKKNLSAFDICTKDVKTICTSVDDSNFELDTNIFENCSTPFVVVLNPDNTINSVVLDNIYSDIITKKALNYLKERASKKRILIYGIGDDAIKLYKRLEIEGLSVDYFIDKNASNDLLFNKKIRSYQDIVFENLEDIFIIFTEQFSEYFYKKEEFLSFGLLQDIDFTYFRDIPPYQTEIKFDVTLSYNRKHSDIEGFELIKNTNDNSAIKIVTLGASTTESIYRLEKSWSYYLVDLFSKNNIPVQLYCGGIMGYSSNQELLKLIRDVVPLSPHAVLLLDGYADIFRHPEVISNCSERINKPFITEYQVEFLNALLSKFPLQHRKIFYGLENLKSPSEFWFDNVRIMQAICKEFDIFFKSFLQPFYFLGKNNLSENQKIIFNRWWNADEPRPLWYSEERINYINSEMKNMIQLSNKVDYIADFTNIFSNVDAVYYDYVHIYEKGNVILADAIYNEISNVLTRMKV